MKRYVGFASLVLTCFLVMFLLIEYLKVPLLTDPTPWLRQGDSLAALVGVGLLVVDVVLPVPSSLVMLMHGVLFGLVVGSLLSLVGSVGAAVVGFAIGRRGGRLLRRVVPDEEREHADRLLSRYGLVAIVVTRPVPLLAETVIILAGASSLGWRRAMLASFAGSLPAAILYAATGAFAASVPNGVVAFGLVLIVAAVFWLISQRVAPRVAIH